MRLDTILVSTMEKVERWTIAVGDDTDKSQREISERSWIELTIRRKATRTTGARSEVEIAGVRYDSARPIGSGGHTRPPVQLFEPPLWLSSFPAANPRRVRNCGRVRSVLVSPRTGTRVLCRTRGP